MGMPLLALWNVINRLANYGIFVVIRATYIYEINQDANAINDALLQQAGYPPSIFHQGDIANMEERIIRHCQLCTTELDPTIAECLVVIVSGTPCQAI